MIIFIRFRWKYAFYFFLTFEVMFIVYKYTKKFREYHEYFQNRKEYNKIDLKKNIKIEILYEFYSYNYLYKFNGVWNI